MKCPLPKKGKPTIEGYKDGKPIYSCLGWYDRMTDEPLPECSDCQKFFRNMWDEEVSDG